jgi:hypothetical protein
MVRSCRAQDSGFGVHIAVDVVAHCGVEADGFDDKRRSEDNCNDEASNDVSNAVQVVPEPAAAAALAVTEAAAAQQQTYRWWCSYIGKGAVITAR